MIQIDVQHEEKRRLFRNVSDCSGHGCYEGKITINPSFIKPEKVGTLMLTLLTHFW